MEWFLAKLREKQNNGLKTCLWWGKIRVTRSSGQSKVVKKRGYYPHAAALVKVTWQNI